MKKVLLGLLAVTVIIGGSRYLKRENLSSADIGNNSYNSINLNNKNILNKGHKGHHRNFGYCH